MAYAIEARSLSKRYGDREVLRGIDLSVEPGTIVGYVGPNGAGKTTTVRILAGLIATWDGHATVGGLDVRRDVRTVKRRTGYVPERVVLYDALTAREHLDLIGRLREMPEPVLERRASSLLDIFELQGDTPMRGFSKGMRQKVMLAAALLHDPEVLFLDEPLSGLDVESTMFVKELLRALADRGRTIFYCSHVLDIVERVCDRILILDRGRIVADGTFESLTAGDAGRSLEQVFRSVTNGAATGPRVRRALDILPPRIGR